jgi:hypothetical protein
MICAAQFSTTQSRLYIAFLAMAVEDGFSELIAQKVMTTISRNLKVGR